MLREIKDRRSVRKYKTDPISDDDILEIIKAAQFAPSAKNNRAWEFYVIRDPEIKTKLQNILGQDFIVQAPVIIIPVIDPGKTVAPVQDLSIASQNIFLQAAALNLGTVWKNVRAEFTDQVKQIIGIPENFTLINIIPVGIPAENIEPHADQDFDEAKIHWQ